MDDDDEFEHSQPHLRTPHAPSLEDQARIAATRAYDEEQTRQRENRARAFLQTSKEFGEMLAAHNVDDERAKKFVIDAAAKTIAEERTKAELEPKELGRLIEAAVKTGLEQEKLERELAVAKDLRAERAQSQPQPQRQTNPERSDTNNHGQRRAPSQPQIDQKSREFFERGERRTGRENQKAQPLGKYRELEDSHRDDSIVRRQQREESDRRQSIDPATRAADNLGRPPVAGEVKEIWRKAKSTITRRDGRPPEDRGGDDRGGGRGDRGGRGGRTR
jgi:hypothetical protein